MPRGCASGGTSEEDEKDPPGKPPGWEASARAARLNGETVVGRGFARDLFNAFGFNAFGRTREDVLLRCGIEIPDERKTRILFRYDAEGGVAEILTYPVSNYADCVVEGLVAVEQPPLPRPDYWLTVVDPDGPQFGPELPGI